MAAQAAKGWRLVAAKATWRHFSFMEAITFSDALTANKITTFSSLRYFKGRWFRVHQGGVWGLGRISCWPGD